MRGDAAGAGDLVSNSTKDPITSATVPPLVPAISSPCIRIIFMFHNVQILYHYFPYLLDPNDMYRFTRNLNSDTDFFVGSLAKEWVTII